MTGYIADTSVFIAAEQRRALGSPPDGVAQISVATITELRLGVLRARSDELRLGVLRARSDELRVLRQETLSRAGSFIALHYGERVAERLAELLAAARDAGRRAGAMDAIIAATALAPDLAVWTQNDDFEVLSELAPKLRVQRDPG